MVGETLIAFRVSGIIVGSTGKQFVVKLPDWVDDVFSRIQRCYLSWFS